MRTALLGALISVSGLMSTPDARTRGWGGSALEQCDLAGRRQGSLDIFWPWDLLGERPIMSGRRALVAVLLVPLTLLSACAADQQVPKMPDSATSTTTSEPTETDAHEAETAEEFVRRWVTASDGLQATGKDAPFRRLSRGCQPCAELADRVVQIYAAGGSIEYAGSEVRLLELTEEDPPRFNLDLESPETLIRDSRGRIDERLPAGVGRYDLLLDGRPGSWRVVSYGRR